MFNIYYLPTHVIYKFNQKEYRALNPILLLFYNTLIYYNFLLIHYFMADKKPDPKKAKVSQTDKYYKIKADFSYLRAYNYKITK